MEDECERAKSIWKFLSGLFKIEAARAYLGYGLFAGSPGACMISGSGSSRALKNSCNKASVKTRSISDKLIFSIGFGDAAQPLSYIYN